MGLELGVFTQGSCTSQTAREVRRDADVSERLN